MSVYDEDMQRLIEWNRKAREVGFCVGYSSSGFTFSYIDPTLPHGVIKNGDGRYFDVLEAVERAEYPLGEGWRYIDRYQVEREA